MLIASCSFSQEAGKGAQAGTSKPGKLVPEAATKDNIAISPTPHGSVSGRMGWAERRVTEKGIQSTCACSSLSLRRWNKSIPEFSWLWCSPGGPQSPAWRRKGINPAFQMPFFQLQKAEKGLGEGDGVQAWRQTLRERTDSLALGGWAWPLPARTVSAAPPPPPPPVLSPLLPLSAPSPSLLQFFSNLASWDLPPLS